MLRRMIHAMGGLALVVALAACSVEGTSPAELGGAAVEDVSQARTAYLSVECAMRDVDPNALNTDTIDQFRATIQESRDLYTSASGALRWSGNGWPSDLAADLTTVADFYDTAAATLDSLTVLSDTDSILAGLEDLGSIDLTAVGDADGRIRARLGISPDLAGECAAR